MTPTPKKPPTPPETARKAAAARRRKPAPKLPTAAPAETWTDAAALANDPTLTEETPVTDNEAPAETPRRTRQADPLLAAKKALVEARKREAKAQARVDAHGDIIAALDAAKEATVAAATAFDEAVAAV